MTDATHTADDDATEEQAIDTSEAEDAEYIRDALPEDIESRLTKQAFSPGTIRELIRDTYYMGPMGVGRGGWIGVYGGGRPGTQMRRPNGALYNFPRSWRYSALQHALETGIITHVGNGKFAATERGVAILRRIDHCHECDEDRVPMVRNATYVGNPNTEGKIENHDLVTQCPECEGTGYNYGSGVVNYDDYDRDPSRVETVLNWLEDYPEARTYGGPNEVRDAAAEEVPETDSEAIEDVLDEYVEDHTPAEPREIFDAEDEDLYERPVITIENEGDHFRFRGTDDALAVSRRDEEGRVHITVDDAENGRLKVGMDANLALDYGMKDRLHYDAEDAEWTGEYWTVAADRLGRVVSKLTVAAYSEDRHEVDGSPYPNHDEEIPEEAEYFTVTVSAAAVEQCDIPLPGIDAEGDLIETGVIGEDEADEAEESESESEDEAEKEVATDGGQQVEDDEGHDHDWAEDEEGAGYTRYLCSKEGCYNTRVTRGLVEHPDYAANYRDLVDDLQRGQRVRVEYTTPNDEEREVVGTVVKSNTGGIRILPDSERRLLVVKVGWIVKATSRDGRAGRSASDLGRGVRILPTGGERPVEYEQREGWTHPED